MGTKETQPIKGEVPNPVSQREEIQTAEPEIQKHYLCSTLQSGLGNVDNTAPVNPGSDTPQAAERNRTSTESVQAHGSDPSGSRQSGMNGRERNRSFYNMLRTGGDTNKRKNAVRLVYTGPESDIPDRKFIGRTLLKDFMGFSANDANAFIHFPGTRQFDINFKLPQIIDLFWEIFNRTKRDSIWKNLKLHETRKVTILFKNGRVPPEDILLWLKRHCKVLTPLRMDTDNNGYWSGGWCANVELIVRHNVPHHLPNLLYIGSERGIVFYPGQPRACFKCGSYRHRSIDCAVVRCSLCDGEGHTNKQCEDVKCNLCGHFGHPHRACPECGTFVGLLTSTCLPGHDTDLEMLVVTDNSVAEGSDSNSDSGQVSESEMENERQLSQKWGRGVRVGVNRMTLMS
uniref:CCHC-type domain-containing protein n=1 Tax=Xenopus tropicalis TaxID=8364 RepID=A0A803KD79_XENTR